jgi:hypothetical protein
VCSSDLKRKFVDIDDCTRLLNWGALRDGHEYPVVIASVDICQNSELVKRHTTKVMERVYYRLWAFLKTKLDHWEGRIWNWAGDGGIFAFRGEQGVTNAVSCCLEILATLPVFNIQPDKGIADEICLRIGLDFGPVKFAADTGRIVSDVINYAAHLEKKGTKPRSLRNASRPAISTTWLMCRTTSARVARGPEAPPIAARASLMARLAAYRKPIFISSTGSVVGPAQARWTLLSFLHRQALGSLRKRGSGMHLRGVRSA